jgi:hypothetical protein
LRGFLNLCIDVLQSLLLNTNDHDNPNNDNDSNNNDNHNYNNKNNNDHNNNNRAKGLLERENERSNTFMQQLGVDFSRGKIVIPPRI